jgi:hypothetical protein
MMFLPLDLFAPSWLGVSPIELILVPLGGMTIGVLVGELWQR